MTNDAENGSERFWTKQDVAEYLQLGVRTVERLIAEEGLPSYRIGGSLRLRKADVDAWVIQRRELNT